ncbi:MAG: hypothetical protein HWE27_09195 [Gammaproteobacteria bacterium]|nr:hypothetical protein [Gammaproteobacteria bacterium]
MKNLSFSVIILVMLSGCVSGYKQPVTDAYKNQKRKVHVASVIAQKELDARAPLQNSAGVGVQFGLIGALISAAVDSSVNQGVIENKETQLAPIRNELIDFEFNDHFHKIATDTLSKVDWLSVSNLSLLNDESDIELNEGEHYLKIDTSYALSTDFTTLQVFSYVTIGEVKKVSYRNGKTVKTEFVPIFKNLYKYSSQSISRVIKPQAERDQAKLELENWLTEKLAAAESGVDKRHYKQVYRRKKNEIDKDYSFAEGNLKTAEKWSVDGATLLKSHLVESAYEIAKMIVLDISDTRTLDELKKSKTEKEYEKGLQIVSESDDRVIVRDTQTAMAGQLCSIVKGSPGNHCKFLL